MKKLCLSIAVLLFILCVMPLTSAAEAPTYLFITSGTDQTIDATLIERIKSLGFDVVVKNHDDFDAQADSAGKIAVYVSESVSSANIVDKFNDVAIPFITGEAYIFEDMGFTGLNAEVDFGSNTESTKGKVIKPDHPIMKGVSADYKAVTRDDLDPLPNYTWGVVPEKNALAVDPDNPERAVVFAFDKGDSSVDSLYPSYKFPEKRAAINFHTSMSVDAVSEDMWKIFDNTIIWAAGVDPLSPPETEAAETEAAEPAAAEQVKSPQTSDNGILLLVLTAVSSAAIINIKRKYNK